MTESTVPIAENAPASTAARIGRAILILATLCVCYFSHLGAIGFVGPDEPRYAWIARDMAETGDWVTPRLYGKPWFEKPPLFYWGAALCFKLFGVSEAAARLPSAISALLATLALAWLALRLYGAETARWLLLLLPTTVGMIGFSHAAATDMPFSGMLTIAMVCAAVVLGLTRNENTPILPHTPWLALLLFGFFLGLAVLAKGPAAIILSGGAIFFWALFTKRWRDVFRLLHPAAIASFCLAALPWYILCARRNPEFFRIFIIEHNFKRYLTPEFQHIQPSWFYGPVLLVAVLPWTGLFLVAVVKTMVNLWRTRHTSELTLFLICWSGFCVLFFSVSQSKLPGYILPAFPAIGLLMTREFLPLVQTYAKYFRLALFASALFLGVLFVLAVFAAPRFSHRNEQLGLAVGLVLAAMGTATLLLGILSSWPRLSPSLQVGAMSCVLPVLLAVSQSNKLLPSLFPSDPSGRSLAIELKEHNIPADKLALVSIHRDMQYSLSFYMHTELRNWDENNAAEGYVLSQSRNCNRFAPPPLTCEEIHIDDVTTGKFLYRVRAVASANGANSGGQPH